MTKNGVIASLHGLNLRQDKFYNTQDMKGVTSLDEDWVVINQMIKYYKYGFGRVSDYINEDIRNNLIDRNKAIKILEKNDGNCSQKYVVSFCEYLNIIKDFFLKKIKKFKNKKLFKIKKKGRPVPKFKVGVGIYEA